MADTVINTPGRTSDDSSAAGWAIAIVILLAAIVLGLLFFRGQTPAATSPTTPGATIDVNLPTGTGGSGTEGSGQNSGSTGGQQQQTGTTQ